MLSKKRFSYRLNLHPFYCVINMLINPNNFFRLQIREKKMVLLLNITWFRSELLYGTRLGVCYLVAPLRSRSGSPTLVSLTTMKTVLQFIKLIRRIKSYTQALTQTKTIKTKKKLHKE